jgi:hypothetical protein
MTFWQGECSRAFTDWRGPHLERWAAWMAVDAVLVDPKATALSGVEAAAIR